VGIEFWDNDDGTPLIVQKLDGTSTWIEGQRYVWARNELGALYRKSCGQVGYELRPRYTLAEYQRQCREMAEAHAAALSPEIRGRIGYEVAMASMFEMAPAPKWDDSPASGAVFL
jgi:hypothetical protein